MGKMNIILASSSPRRRELLKLVTSEFEVINSEVDERLEVGISATEQAINLSYMKAKSVFDKTMGDRIVIGSDTMVVKHGKIYGKPKDIADARKMLKELLEGDRCHKIITGLAVIVQKEGTCRENRISDEVKVCLRSMTDLEIDSWVNKGKIMDKAGGYGMQDEFCVFVERIEGNYSTAIGLPTHKLYDILKDYLD